MSLFTRRALGVLAGAALLTACGGTPTQPASPSASSSAATSPAASTSASSSPSPSASASPSPSASASPSPSASASPSPSATATASPSEEATTAATGTASGSIVTTPAENGAQRFENTTEGFAVTLPAGWDVIDLESPEVDQALQEGLARGGFTDLPLDIDALVAAGVKLLAIDFEPDQNTGYGTTMNIIKPPVGNATLDQIAGQAASQLQQGLGVDTVEQERVTVGDAEAVELRYVLDPPAENVPSLATTQYIFDENRSNYVVTFSTIEETQDAYAPVFDEIVQSFEVTP